MTLRAQAEALRGLPPETLAARYWEAERRFDFREAAAHLFAAIADGHTLPVELIEDAAFSVPAGGLASALIMASAEPVALAESWHERLSVETAMWLAMEVLLRVERAPEWIRLEAAAWQAEERVKGRLPVAVMSDAIALINDPSDSRAREALLKLQLRGEKVLLLLERAPGPPALSVRKTARPSPNQPCWCGSGLKFKRCCASKPAVVDARTLFERSNELGPAHAEHLTGWDWRSLDLKAVTTPTLMAVFERPSVRDDFRFARRALVELATRGCDVDWPAFRLAKRVWHTRELGEIDALLSLVKAESFSDLDLYRRRESLSPGLDAIEAFCRSVVRQKGGRLPLDFLSPRWPSLMLLMTRGAMLDADFEGRKAHAETIERLRARIGLSGRDPAARLVSEAASKRYDVEFELTTTLALLDRKLDDTRPLVEQRDEARAKVAALEKESAALRAQLVDPQTADGQLARLRAKVDELKAELTVTKVMLREAREVEAPAKPEVATAKDEPVDDGDEATVEEVEGPPRLVRFDRAAEAALAELPEAVVRPAIERAGELGGGRAGAFREVKRMRGVRHVFSCRLGIHHRMLFTLAPAELVVVEIIHRAELDRSLEHLAVAPRPSSPGGRKAHQT